MRPLSEVRELVLGRCEPRPAQEVELRLAQGCVLVEDVVATDDVPGFAGAAVDGFAVRALDLASATVDLPVVLEVIDTVAAGRASLAKVGSRQAVRIMAGAPVPVGADAIVPIEMTRHSSGFRGDGETVAVLVPSAPGAHIRPAGDDVTAGTTVIRADTVLSPPLIGVLAALGRPSVPVHPRPRVGVMSTGDELVEPWRGLDVGQIRDANRPMLLAAVAAAGATPIDLGPVRDDADAVAAALRSAATRCDLILTSGGVSMGEADVVKLVLERLSDPLWLRIAIKPAQPFGLATIEGVPLLALPGNPVSSFVSFELLARPAIRHLAGHADLDRPHVTARAGSALRRHADGNVHYLRVTFDQADDGTLIVHPVTAQGSHQLVATAAAQGLAIVPEGEGVAEGELVEVIVLDPAGALAGVAERGR